MTDSSQNKTKVISKAIESPLPPVITLPGAEAQGNLSSQRDTFHETRESEKPRKGKYVKKADRVDDEKLTELAKSLAGMGGEMLKFVSRRMPNPLPPTDTEIETFMGATTELVKKYLPLANKYQPELVFAGFLVFFITPRMVREKKENVESRIVADAQAIIDEHRTPESPSPSPL